MFIGHFGVAFGAKNSARTVSLGTLIMASLFLDLIWAFFLLIGIEHVEIRQYMTEVTPLEFTEYPLSHSLAMTLVWSATFTIVYGCIRKNWGGAFIVGLCVLSHWVLDMIVHVPDLPFYPGGVMRIGLGLWNSLPGTFLIEAALFIVGVVYYLRVTEEENATGVWALWGLIVVLTALGVLNLFGPDPRNQTVIIVTSSLQWLLVIWGYWVNHNRYSDPVDIDYDRVPIGPRIEA
jgi:hypothetical protein